MGQRELSSSISLLPNNEKSLFNSNAYVRKQPFLMTPEAVKPSDCSTSKRTKNPKGTHSPGYDRVFTLMKLKIYVFVSSQWIISLIWSLVVIKETECYHMALIPPIDIYLSTCINQRFPLSGNALLRRLMSSINFTIGRSWICLLERTAPQWDGHVYCIQKAAYMERISILQDFVAAVVRLFHNIRNEYCLSR